MNVLQANDLVSLTLKQAALQLQSVAEEIGVSFEIDKHTLDVLAIHTTNEESLYDLTNSLTDSIDYIEEQIEGTMEQSKLETYQASLALLEYYRAVIEKFIKLNVNRRTH